MNAVRLIASLSDAFGVAGFEDEVREVIRESISPYVDEIRTDVLGNLIAVRNGKSKRTLMLDAHMDEVGFIVKWIDGNGYLRFSPLGGWDPRILPTHRVTVQTRDGEKRLGVIGAAPPHILSPEARERPIPLEDLFVDIGASSGHEATDMGIRIGDPLTIHYPFTEIHDGYVTGKAFDDRVGCAVLIQTAERLADRDLDWTIAYSFAVGEEVGLRGARTAAHEIRPDLALAIEGTIGADMPGVREDQQPVRLGQGPAITVADRSIIVSRRVIDVLERIADESSIPFQYKLPTYGGTDAGAIHLTRGGVLSGVLSVPCRFIHSPASTMRMNDFENTVRMVSRFVEIAPRRLFDD